MLNDKKLSKREDISDKFKWKLEDIFFTDDDWKKAFDATKLKAQEILKYKGVLSSSPDKLLECLKKQDEISEALEKIYVYAHMRSHQDMNNTHYQRFSDQATSLNIEISGITSFIIPEILAIPLDLLNDYMNSDNGIKYYDKYLNNIIRQKEHVLPAEQELLLAQVAEIGQGPQNIFNMFNNADIRFPSIKDDKGNDIEVTKGRYITLMKNPNRNVRKDAFKSMYSSYIKNKNTLSATYTSSVKTDVFFAKTRNYNCSLESALFENNISTNVYNQLIHTVHENLHLMHRYLDIRKRMLNIDEIHMYDLYVPIVKNADVKISFEEAKKLIKKGLEPLGNEYLSILQKGFDEAWIDVYENEGKRSGAYSWGAYGSHPYVLMNYQNNINSMFTLAHEMGHALHSYYSDMTQGYRYAGYKIFLAEIASTVNEALLMEHLLNSTEDTTQNMYLINYFMEQFRGTLYRQTMFAEFEKLTHEFIEDGKSLNHEVLCKLYRDLNKKYYGDNIILDAEIDMEWARIPHFYRAYYVYQYATGYSSAIALSQKILNEGESAVNRYLDFLKAGDSDYPLNILNNAGVDMTTPTPIREALKVFERLLDKMEAYCDQ